MISMKAFPIIFGSSAVHIVPLGIGFHSTISETTL